MLTYNKVAEFKMARLREHFHYSASAITVMEVECHG